MSSHPHPTVQVVDPHVLYRDLAFPAGPDGRPYVVINMIATVDGKAALSGRSGGIGSRLDRAMMRRIRAAADAVLTGAGTLRAEDVDLTVPADLQEARLARGLPRNPLAAVLSASGDLPLSRKFFRLTDAQAVVFVAASAPPARIEELRARARVLLLDPAQPAVPQVMRLLRSELGARSLVVEGGPSLNAEVVGLSYADELFLTVAPKVAGGPGVTIMEGAPLPREQIRRLELLSVSAHESELFLRYRFVT